ncbi:MAG TPA: hypothetical protein VGV61_00565 [Thermoanaerobaculia bacterium]|jgi:hypothetical protein|nr:hypothetical protein [Thermoanaerobaculia bacterium]
MRSALHGLTFAAALAAAIGSPAGAAGAGAPAPPPGPVFDITPLSLRLFNAETRYWTHLRQLLSSGDQRRMSQANSRFQLQTAFWSDPQRDPFYDRARNNVRDGYVKLYKEMLRREYPLDDFVEEVLQRGRYAERVAGPSWRVDVVPRLAIGSHGYVGARLALPDTGNPVLGRYTMQVRRGYFNHEWALGLRYNHGPRYFELERVTGDRKTGDRYSGTVVLRF